MNPHHQRIKTEDIDYLKKEMKSLDLKAELAKSLAFEPMEPARDIVTKSYSLAPDMAGGWKPRNIEKKTNRSPFLLQYQDPLTDYLLEQLSRKDRVHEKIVYLGSRKACSFALHENRPYSNPYPSKNRNISSIFNKNKGRQNIKAANCFLMFDSDFECGNLDLAIQKAQKEFDLFMRVDTNTRGHSNWYFFCVRNGEFTGRIKFNICNFKREESLYQKGLRPFVKSLNQGTDWSQEGTDIRYQRYKCPFLDEGTNQQDRLSKYFMLTFDYEFKSPNDTVQFAYGVPYLYSQLLTFIGTLKKIEWLQPLKSLCGLDIPVLRITNQQTLDQSKKIMMITARVHPGESNSSYVMQGFLRCLCGDSTLSKLLKNTYIFYVVPMLNPDGVVAGNYRTSLFGKDLNRTYDLSRKYAFPQTFQLLQLAKKLKDKYKQRFSIFIDLHGHSTKKNVFMYGPDYSIQTTNYYRCRQLPKILSHVTSFFRYFSCSFRISGTKSSTARAVFNRALNIPFSYTMESSNGIFLNAHNENIEVTSFEWKQIGFCLCQALNNCQADRFSRIRRIKTQKTEVKSLFLNQAKEEFRQDDLEGDSDIDNSEEDFAEEILFELQRFISEGKCKRIPITIQKPATKNAEEELPEKKISRSTNKQSKKIIKREATQQKRADYKRRQIELPQIMRHRGQIPIIRSRKKQHVGNINSSSKRYAVLPLEQVSFVERQSKSIVFIQDSTETRQQQRPINIDRRNKRDKILHSLVERLKTLK